MDDEPSSLSRRSLLAGGAAVVGAFAGCVGTGGGDCSFGFELTATPATDEDYIEETLTGTSRDRPDTWREIVSATVADGETRYSAVHATPVRDGDRIEYEGIYYRFAVEEVAVEEVEAHRFATEYESGREPPSGATVVAFGDLPAADRAAIREVLPDLDRRLAGTEGFSTGGYPVVYPDDASGESVLLGEEPTWVRYEGEAIEVRVEGTERVERITYRYTAEELAADRGSYLRYVRETFVVDLGDVPEAEREVLSRAIDAGDDGIQLCEPEGPERAVIDRLEAIPESKTPRDRTWFVDYEGEVYLTSLLEFAA
jgi:hypothetical protein